MKRILIGGAAAAALLTAGTPALASAATTHRVTRTVTRSQTRLVTKTTASTTAKCKLSLVTQINDGTSVLAGSADGKQAGKTSCGGALGSGIAHDSFATNDAGNLYGPIQQWFNTGTVYGSYFLKVIPYDGPPSPTSFSSVSYSGTIKIKGGHGALYGATGTGTMSCSSSDSARYTCTEKLSLSLPSAQS